MSMENPAPKKENIIPKKERPFSFIKNVGDYEVAVGIEKGEGSMRVGINTNTKKVEAFVTPEGIQKACEYFKKPETQKAINNFLEDVRDRLKNNLERKKKEMAERKLGK